LVVSKSLKIGDSPPVFPPGTGKDIIIEALRLPIPDSIFKRDFTTPWIGSFGNKIQIVVDDNEENGMLTHSLYVSGSEYSNFSPGGNLYWFLIPNNISKPLIKINLVIKDAKLLRLLQLNKYNQCTLKTKNVIDYMNSFASSFYVTSGNGKNNVLIVGNPSNEDCQSIIDTQPAMPNGYVQGYVIDPNNSNLGWTQKQSIDSKDYFLYRYDGHQTIGGKQGDPGFGYSLFWINNYVIIGGTTNDSNNQAYWGVWKWSDKNPDFVNTITAPFALNPTLYRTGNLGSIVNYNIFIKRIEDNILFSVPNMFKQQDCIMIINPNSNSNSNLKFQTDSTTTVQVLGKDFQPDLLPNVDVSFKALAQCLGIWISRTQQTLYLIINDPDYNYYEGRILLLAKNLNF